MSSVLEFIQEAVAGREDRNQQFRKLGITQIASEACLLEFPIHEGQYQAKAQARMGFRGCPLSFRQVQ